MVMRTKLSVLVSAVAAVTALALTSGAAQVPVPDPAPAQPPVAQAPSPGDRFAWADACKSCHAEIYESWAKTKHARTIDRLSAEERGQSCVVCHSTGGTGRIERDGKFVNQNVQCEACHGAAAAHVADSSNRVGLTKSPQAKVCEGCHNAKSPSFKGFVFQGMSRLSHSMPKK
jgi:predicted CXXCH cytochrome family protein